MLYAKLVARISEVTRTLVARGSGGKFDQNSTIFHAGIDVPESRGGWLRVLSGEGAGTYRVFRSSSTEILTDDPFPATDDDVSWELYDAGVPEEAVRDVLQALPDVIMECEEGEQVKTHMGVIKIVRRKRKRVKDPSGQWTYSPERLQARLRPGKRLQKMLEEPSESRSGLLDDLPDEDPES